MQSFLNFVDKWLHYAALTLMCVWFVALVFVMRNVQIQDFIVAYGFQTSAMLLAFSIVAHWLAKWHGGLELTEIYRRDAVVNAFVGSATLIFCGLIVSVFPTWLTGVFSLMFATFVLFGVVEVLEACIDWRRGAQHYRSGREPLSVPKQSGAPKKAVFSLLARLRKLG